MAQAWEPLFDELVELDPASRETRLTEIQQDDPGLAALLRRLLSADRADATLAEPILGRAATMVVGALAEPVDPTASVIGPYRLLDSLGVGGMGEVYRAERCDGEFEKQVAIKRIRIGTGSEAILDRFIRERQIL
ncbi:MAG: hypothetical protein KDA28_02410, partial [Phycisphaerales bacterium]|nr:hypothetical protein [Phycisphaerales bacterium]